MIECPLILHTILHAKALKQSFVEGNKTTLIAYILSGYSRVQFLILPLSLFLVYLVLNVMMAPFIKQSFILCYLRRLKRLNKQYYIETYFPSATMMPYMHFSSYVAL